MKQLKFQNLFLFGKAQLSAFVGGLVDYGTMVFLTEMFGFHYVHSIIIGGIIGAIVNFSINRYWTFKKQSKPIIDQLLKFSVVVVGSILFKSLGTFLLTDYVGIDYKISRIIADAIVCFGFNYFMQKKWVFS